MLTWNISNLKYFLKCSNTQLTKKWASENKNCLNDIPFQPSTVLPNGRLPTLKSVIEYFYHLQSVDSYFIEYNVILDLMNHWVKYNVYTQARKTVPPRLTTQLEKLKYLKNYQKDKKKNACWKQYNEFVQQVNYCLISFLQMRR